MSQRRKFRSQRGILVFQPHDISLRVVCAHVERLDGAQRNSVGIERVDRAIVVAEAYLPIAVLKSPLAVVLYPIAVL